MRPFALFSCGFKMEWEIDVNLLYTCESKKATKWVKTSRREQVSESIKAIVF